MPPSSHRPNTQMCDLLHMTRIWLTRRFIGRRLLYLTLSLFLFSIIAIQFSAGKPNAIPKDENVAINRVDVMNRDDPVQMRPDEQNELDKPVQRQNNNKPSSRFHLKRRIVHLDLKGAAYKVTFFPVIFDFFVKLNFTGILLEWEDMFPYTGKLAGAVNGDAYSMNDVHSILKAAKERNLEVIPLVQTFGHLEWILKLQEFAHMREDPRYPQVVCFGAASSFDMVKDMINQVASVHKQYGMPFFHMGADEVFQIGVCSASVEQMRVQGGKERAMLWYMAKVAAFVKETHATTVLAWHDMFAHMIEQDLAAYNLNNLVEPVLWSYAEDLDMYLPFQTWISLKPFKNVWGASAFKGADGPLRYVSNPKHYIKNHESWISQFNRAYREFDEVRGLIFTGWSRYDHLSIMCELLPTALPQLAMSAETMMNMKAIRGVYPKSKVWLGCNPSTELAGVNFGCDFPGVRIYETVNEFWDRRKEIKKYLDEDFDFNGWVSKIAEKLDVSSPMYAERVVPQIDFYLGVIRNLERRLRDAMQPIYFQETIDEYVFTYMSDLFEQLEKRRAAAIKIVETKTFPKRPYIKYSTKHEL